MMAEYTDIPLSEIICDGMPTGTFAKGYRTYSAVEGDRTYSAIEGGWVTPYIEFNLLHDVPLSFSLREFDVWMAIDQRRVGLVSRND